METIREAVESGELTLSTREKRWFLRLVWAVEDLPDDPEDLRARLNPAYADLYIPDAYGL